MYQTLKGKLEFIPHLTREISRSGQWYILLSKKQTFFHGLLVYIHRGE